MSRRDSFVNIQASMLRKENKRKEREMAAMSIRYYLKTIIIALLRFLL